MGLRMRESIARTAFVFLLAGVFAVSTAGADVYSYTDRNGVVHFTNIFPGRGSSYRVYLHTPDQRRPRPGVRAVPAHDRSADRYSRYDDHIKEASLLYQIPEYFIRAIILVESDYDPNVVSCAGAQGLMQLMPGTARRMGVENPFDPRQNILGGTRYLRFLANLFDGDIVLTIAGYHAGEGAVLENDGVPPYTMTVEYIRKVLNNYYRYRDGEK